MGGGRKLETTEMGVPDEELELESLRGRLLAVMYLIGVKYIVITTFEVWGICSK